MSKRSTTRDWVIDQIVDLFRTTHQVKTQQVVKNRGNPCGDIKLEEYLVKTTGPVSLVLDLLLAHTYTTLMMKIGLNKALIET